MSAKDERAERLARALRDNLRLRKAQARGEAGTGGLETDPGADADATLRNADDGQPG